MLRQIFVFTKSPELTSIKEMRTASKALNCEIIPINPFEHITWSSSFGFTGQALGLLENLKPDPILLIRTSGIEFDDVDLLSATELKKKGLSLTCPIDSQRILRNKDAQTLWMRANNVPHIQGLIHRGPLSKDQLHKWHMAKEYVIKSVRGNKGIGVRKFSPNDLISFWEERRKAGDQRYLIQPYIKGREFRQLVIGEEHFFIEKKGNRDWRRNAQYSQFVKIEENDLPQSQEILIQRAKTIQEKLRLKSFALDLLETDGELHVLEINGQPGLTSASELFEENLYELYLKAILRN